ncbi:MAG: phosphatidate cytidylyltransferase [Rubrobacter sp.]|nr:phosphatidate cytidylyltransferase [Rubrobacter sp.]
MLQWRLLTALVLAPIVLGIIMAGRWAIALFIVIIVGLAAYELARALTPLSFTATFGAGALPVVLSIPYGTSGALAGVVSGLPWALFWLSSRPEARTLRSFLAFLLMTLWIGMPLAHLVLIRELPDGRYLVLIVVVGPWISDSAAYFAGRFLGHHELSPVLSPKKTYEGAIGGLVVTVVAVGYFAHAFLDVNIIDAVILGVVVSVSSQAGDLFESVLKRILHLKDLGRILPGHGGILDRIDSLLFTTPAVYYLYVLFML